MLFGLFKRYKPGYYSSADNDLIFKLISVKYGLFVNKYTYQIVKNGDVLFLSDILDVGLDEMFSNKRRYSNTKVIEKINSLYNTLYENIETNHVYKIMFYFRSKSTKRFNSVILKSLTDGSCVRVRLQTLYNNYRKIN